MMIRISVKRLAETYGLNPDLVNGWLTSEWDWNDQTLVLDDGFSEPQPEEPVV
jgi:hypothetical protein